MALDFNKLKVLSGGGQEYELPESVRMQCVFCVDEKGSAYELQTPTFRPDVANRYLTAKMRFAKLNPQKGTVEGSVISKIYKVAEDKGGTVSPVSADSVPLERARREFLSIVIAAMEERAVDIHFIVREHNVKVLFRINGKMERIDKFAYTRDSITGLLGAIYGETKDSNDQSFSPRLRSSCTIKYVEPPVSLRWQTIPTGDAHGLDYDVVLRVTRQDTGSTAKLATLGELGYLDDQVELLTAACNSKGGIFMSGVTGSGKTTALRSLMQIVRGNGEIKIYTVEDPIELKIFGATQINIRGGSMSETIKALMRADPDTIMVGEIRGTRSGGGDAGCAAIRPPDADHDSCFFGARDCLSPRFGIHRCEPRYPRRAEFCELSRLSISDADDLPSLQDQCKRCARQGCSSCPSPVRRGSVFPESGYRVRQERAGLPEMPERDRGHDHLRRNDPDDRRDSGVAARPQGFRSVTAIPPPSPRPLRSTQHDRQNFL